MTKQSMSFQLCESSAWVRAFDDAARICDERRGNGDTSADDANRLDIADDVGENRNGGGLLIDADGGPDGDSE